MRTISRPHAVLFPRIMTGTNTDDRADLSQAFDNRLCVFLDYWY